MFKRITNNLRSIFGQSFYPLFILELFVIYQSDRS